jgi:hypothetical protein
MDFANLAAYTFIIIDVNVEVAINQNVERVTSPVTLVDYLFTGALNQQTCVWSNLLAGIVPTVNN